MTLLPRRFSTPRLTARAVRREDAVAMFEAWASDPECTRYLAFPTATELGQTREFCDAVARHWADGRGHLSWMLHAGRELVGGLGASLDGSRVTAGYVISRAHWGQGYATEALRQLCELALARPAIWRVEAHCYVEHLASARVMEKAGMQREGILRRHTVLPNLGPEPLDVLCYARVRGGDEPTTARTTR